jgi:hypothetical protein
MWTDMLAVASHNWTWLSAALVLGMVVGFATCREARRG